MIKAAFKKAGIWLLDKKVVIDRLPTIDVRRANPPPQAAPAPPVTPPTPVRAIDIVTYMQKHLYSINLLTRETTLLSHHVEKLSKGAVAVAAAREQAVRDLNQMMIAAQHCRRHQVSNRCVIQSSSTVHVHDARLRAAKHNHKDKKGGQSH